MDFCLFFFSSHFLAFVRKKEATSKLQLPLNLLLIKGLIVFYFPFYFIFIFSIYFNFTHLCFKNRNITLYYNFFLTSFFVFFFLLYYLTHFFSTLLLTKSSSPSDVSWLQSNRWLQKLWLGSYLLNADRFFTGKHHHSFRCIYSLSL